MPQKLNPDVAELVRGKAGTAIGRLAGLLAVVKGLPLAYNRDLQEDKTPVFAARRDVRGALGALAVLVGGLEVDHERAVEAGSIPRSATDAAEVLVREAFLPGGLRARGGAAGGRAVRDAGADESIAVRGAPGPAAWTAHLPPPGASGIDLVADFEDVAAVAGTPFYAYDGGLFRERIRRFRAALDAPHLLCYALKAKTPCARQDRSGGGLADIVSGGSELDRRCGGVPAERIVFSGVQRRRRSGGLEAGVRSLNVESLGELTVAEEGPRSARRAGLRAAEPGRGGRHARVRGDRLGAEQFGLGPDAPPTKRRCRPRWSP
jgi:hypothetical protein